MLVINSFKAQNFLSFEEVEFRINGPTLTYVGGSVAGDSSRSNGAGKSSLWEIVPFALYGKTVRGSLGDDVRQRGKACVVAEVAFEVDDARYNVVRQRGKKNVLKLEMNGEDISSVDVSSTQERLEEILGMSFELFTNSVVFGQGLSYRFIQAPDSEKKAIFEQLLSLGWIRDSQQKAKELLAVVKMKWEEEGRELASLSLEKAHLEEEVSRWEDSPRKLEKLEREAKSKEESMTRAADEVERLERAAEANKVAASKAKERVVQVDSLCLWFAKITALVDKERALQRGIERSERESFKSVAKLEGVECPTCHQVVPAEYVGSVEEIYKDKLAELEEWSNKLGEELLRWDKISVGVNDMKETAEAALQKLSDEVAHARELASVKFAAFSGIEAEWKGLQRELASVKAVALRISKLKEDAVSVTARISTTQEKMEELNGEMTIFEFWVDAFGNRGMKSLLLDSVVGWMNQVAAQLASRISDGDFIPIFSSISTLKGGGEREVFSVQVRHGEDVIDYKSISGGEKRRVDVVVLLTLCRLLGASSGREVNLLVFDEVFESLDSQGIENVMAVLADFRALGKSVYVVSHQEDAKVFFDEELMVVKSEGGASRIA